jgi:hypothetical protein
MTRDAAVWMLAGALSFGAAGCGSEEPAPEPDADGADDAALDDVTRAGRCRRAGGRGAAGAGGAAGAAGSV